MAVLDFFTYSEMKSPSGNGDTSSHTVVYCKNSADLLNTVPQSRNVSFEQTVKLGINGKKGFRTKIVLLRIYGKNFQKRLLTQKQAKNTGVKRQK